MRTIKLLGYHPSGDPRAWWSWENLSQRYKRERQLDQDSRDMLADAWPRHGRAWLHWYTSDARHNCIAAEWDLFSRSCGISLNVSDQACDEHAITIGIRVPFIGSLWMSLDRAKWVEKLPGVNFVQGSYSTGQRELSLRFLDNALWWNVWVDPFGSTTNWRDNSFHFDHFLFGRHIYSESPRTKTSTYLYMPEGMYACTVELFTATWKRPRWPWAKSIQRAHVTIEEGLPIPGKGEESWQSEDDNIFEVILKVDSVERALREVKKSAMNSREKYASADWVPSGGWPAHCQKVSDGSL